MNRTQSLAIATAVLLVFVVVYHVWADWGLITVHAKQQPLGRIIASIERQGHAKIETDMPGDTPVTMNVDKVPLTQALEALSVVTESRWRLLFFAAGDKATLRSAELSWFGGQHPDGWKMVSFPMGNMMMLSDDDSAPLDPRGDVWTPKTTAPAQVQVFFTEAAQLTNAGFAFPESWNPTVKSTPPSGSVDRVVPKLIKSAGGRQDELFFLSKNTRRGPRGNGEGDPRPDLDLIAEREQAQIDRLPPEQREEAQTNFNTQRAFLASLKDMTDEQRRDAWMQHMQDPQVQQQIANRMDAADALMNHNQRMQRMQNFVNRKFTAMGKM